MAILAILIVVIQVASRSGDSSGTSLLVGSKADHWVLSLALPVPGTPSLVDRLLIGQTVSDPALQCSRPSNEILFDDDVVVTRNDSGADLLLAYERSAGSDLLFPARGHLTNTSCSRQTSLLEVPTAIDLLPGAITHVDILVPKDFNVTRAASSPGVLEPARPYSLDSFTVLNFDGNYPFVLDSDDRKNELLVLWNVVNEGCAFISGSVIDGVFVAMSESSFDTDLICRDLAGPNGLFGGGAG